MMREIRKAERGRNRNKEIEVQRLVRITRGYVIRETEADVRLL